MNLEQLVNGNYLTLVAKKLPKGKTSFNEFIYKEVFLKNTLSVSDFLYLVSITWNKTEKFNQLLKFFQSLGLLEYKNDNFNFVSAYYRKVLNHCPMCGKECLTSHCSPKCSNSDPLVQEKKSETCFKHFGARTPGESKELQEKAKQTCLKHYGTEYSFQAKEVKEKIKESCLKKYGVEHSMKSETVKARQKSVIREHLGVDYPMQSKNVREKSRQTCLEKYGVDNISKTDWFKNFIYSQRKNYQDFNESYIREHFVKDNAFCVKEFCEHFEIQCRSALNRFKRHFNILEPNNDTTIVQGKSKFESEFFKWIPAEHKISGSRQIIPPLELDMFLPDFKIAIEYNGNYFHSDTRKSEGYHIFKTKACEKLGIQLFHMFEFENSEIWKSVISGKLGLNQRIFARKCELREVSSSEAKTFLTENHLQGACNASVRLGLYHNNELVQIMTFGKPRFNKRYDYELLRCCSKKFTNVIGGASKLLKHFRDFHKGSIISYANRRFSNGNLYRKLGFTEKGVTDVNYFYAKGNTVLTRYQCQKHKLKDLLEDFDPNLSERDNMLNNGYYRIYDCGNYIFILT